MTFEYLLSLLKRALPLALIGMLGMGAVALVYSLVSPKVYLATARILVQPSAPITIDPDQPQRGPAYDESLVDTQVEVMESPVIADKVVRGQNLIADPEFGRGSVAATAKQFAKALQIRRVGMTSLVDISVESGSAQRAAQLADMTANAYVEAEKDRLRAETQAANKLLKDRVDAMASEVRDADAAVQNFRIENNLMSVNGATLSEQSAAVINDSLAQARAEENAAAAALASVRSASLPLGQANTQPALAAARAQQAAAQQEMSAVEAKYGPQHPVYIAAQQRLRESNRAVAAESSRGQSAVAANRQVEVSQAQERLAAASNKRRSLEQSAGANASSLARNSRAATQLSDLQRKADALRSTYNTYLTRYQQTLTQLGTERGSGKVLSPAVVPSKPYKPNTMLNVVLGLLGGLLSGIGVAAAMMMFESHFSTGKQVEKALGLEALPSLPSARSSELDVSDSSSAGLAEQMRLHPTGSFSEMHKSLIAALDRPTRTGPNKIVAITSALPKEGKTTASICLAQAAAQLGKRVLLIDADQRRRGVTRALMPEAARGLRDVLTGAANWREVVRPGTVPGMDLLPATRVAEANVDIFSSVKLPELFDSLRQAYDLVLVDTAPVLPIVDTRIIVRHVNSVLLLCRWRSTPRRAVSNALDTLAAADAAIAGLALTVVDLNGQTKFGYGDTAFYYKQYRSYYNSVA